MKYTKKLFAMLLAVMLVLALAAPAFADGATGSITITPKDNGDHTFTAYQIFAGELSASGVLSNVVWGTAINDNGAALINALATDQDSGSYFTGCTTAANVAEALDKLIGDKGADAAAKVLTDAFETVTLATGTALTKDTADGKYKATALAVGYYLVKDEVTAGTAGAKASDMILEVVGEVNIDAKADIPQVTKKADADSYGIGDKIEYTLTATVPDYDATATDDYRLEFTDTMANSLDLVYDHQANENEPTGGIVVKMDGTDVTGSFEIRYDTTNHILTVKCANIGGITGITANSVFTVTYSATINSTYTQGDVNNKVVIITKDYTSPEIEEKVFPVSLTVNKVSGGDAPVPLAGAEFVLSRTKADGAAEYVQVNADGKVVGWTTDKAQASKLTTALNEDNSAATVNVIGLEAGDYELEETKAPDNYNLPAAAFKLNINATVNQAGDALQTVSVSVNGGAPTQGDAATGVVTATIENNKGATLPTTGGIGTTIFYIVGAVLVIGAGVLLITKKRMSANED